MRDVERQLDDVAEQSRAALEDLIGRTKRILTQKQKDKNKLYALHAPEVECLAKGKARKPYEFGVKVSITTTHKEGLVIGARSMPGNPYHGHTLAEALEQAAILSDVQPEIAAAITSLSCFAMLALRFSLPRARLECRVEERLRLVNYAVRTIYESPQLRAFSSSAASRRLRILPVLPAASTRFPIPYVRTSRKMRHVPSSTLQPSPPATLCAVDVR